MKMHGKHEPISLFDVEDLLYVQEALLDKFRQDLDVSNVIFQCGLHKFASRWFV